MVGFLKGLTGFLSAAAIAASVYAQLGADNKPIVQPKRVNPREQSGCGKAWWAKYDGLSKEVREYNSKHTQATAEADLDREGTLDFIMAQSMPNFEPCSLKEDPAVKRNTIWIRYDADHRWDVEFEGDLIHGMRIYPDKQFIQVYGEKINGEGWQRTFHYELPPGRGAKP